MNEYEKLLKEDIEQIYLGNLSTVEADIDLPLKVKKRHSVQLEQQ